MGFRAVPWAHFNLAHTALRANADRLAVRAALDRCTTPKKTNAPLSHPKLLGKAKATGSDDVL